MWAAFCDRTNPGKVKAFLAPGGGAVEAWPSGVPQCKHRFSRRGAECTEKGVSRQGAKDEKQNTGTFEVPVFFSEKRGTFR